MSQASRGCCAWSPIPTTWSAAGVDVRLALVTSGEAGIDGLAPAEAGPLREQE